MLAMGFISRDKALCEAVLEQMKLAEGWQSAVFASIEEAQDVWQKAPPPLVLLDSGGFSVESARCFLDRLCGLDQRPWVLVLGELSLDGEMAEVVDFLSKPLRLGNLLARLQFYKKRMMRSPDTAMALGGWVFYPRRRRLLEAGGGRELFLTDKEAALLERLATADSPVSKSRLLEDIWGYGEKIDTHTLETHIYLLRRKLTSSVGKEEDCFLVEQGCYRINPAWR